MIRAIHFPDRAAFTAKKVPGSFWISDPETAGRKQAFWYCCPCGCSAIAPLSVGNGFKPSDGPSWQWNGSKSEATLHPSVNHINHWHGWLRDGYWESC